MENLFYSLLGIIVGAIFSYIITKYYYKKSSVTEKDVINLFYSIEKIYLNSKYPSIFNSNTSYKRNYKNQNSNNDIPFVMTVCAQSNLIEKGSRMLVLCRVQDLGRNFYSNGIKITNMLNNYNVPFDEEGFGWFSFYIDVPDDAFPGKQKICVDLVDSVGNTSSFIFEYIIK